MKRIPVDRRDQIPVNQRIPIPIATVRSTYTIPGGYGEIATARPGFVTAVDQFILSGELNTQTVGQVVSWLGSHAEWAVLETVLQKCEYEPALALGKVYVRTYSEATTAEFLRRIAKYPSIRALTLDSVMVDVLAAAALRDLLLAPPGVQASHIESLELTCVELGKNFAVMRDITECLKESPSLQSLTFDGAKLTHPEYRSLLESACQNVNLVRLTLMNFQRDETVTIPQIVTTILASQVRDLSIASDTLDDLAAVVKALIQLPRNCPLATIELPQV